LDKKYIALIIVILAVVGAVIFSGGGSYTSANISDVVMSEGVYEDNYEPINTTETFSTNADSFHLTGEMNNVPSNTKVSSKWYYLDASGDEWDGTLIIENEEKLMGEAELNIDQSQRVHFFYTRNTDYEWPEGDYEVKIYIEGKGNVENVQFSVHENIE